MISQEKYKNMLEEETEVIDFNACNNILKELGLVKLRSDKKFRESYRIGNILYEIDTWDENIYPKPYLEVEAQNETALIEGIKLIGYTLKDTTSKTLKELKAEFKKTLDN
jgi:adenylate cyclase class 2